MTESNSNSSMDFRFAFLPAIRKRAFRMGIAGNYGINSADIGWAAERGVNYWVWGASFKRAIEGIKEIIRQDREKHVVAMLGWGFFGWQIRKSVEKALNKLDTDYLDVFKLGWLGRTSAYTEAVIDALLKLKKEGLITWDINNVKKYLHNHSSITRRIAYYDIGIKITQKAFNQQS